MNGELLTIIYDFYMSIFNSATSYKSFGVANNAFYNGLMGDNNFFQDFYTFLNSTGTINGSGAFYIFISYVLTFITAGFLLVCLFKLFKWMFTLIFKLFRLN